MFSAISALYVCYLIFSIVMIPVMGWMAGEVVYLPEYGRMGLVDYAFAIMLLRRQHPHERH